MKERKQEKEKERKKRERKKNPGKLPGRSTTSILYLYKCRQAGWRAGGQTGRWVGGQT
jgi:hypothetical protein